MIQEEISLYLVTCLTHAGKMTTSSSGTKSDLENHTLLLGELAFSGGETIWIKMV